MTFFSSKIRGVKKLKMRKRQFMFALQFIYNYFTMDATVYRQNKNKRKKPKTKTKQYKTKTNKQTKNKIKSYYKNNKQTIKIHKK